MELMGLVGDQYWDLTPAELAALFQHHHRKEEDEWDRWRHQMALHANKGRKKGSQPAKPEDFKKLYKDKLKMQRAVKDASAQWERAKKINARDKAKRLKEQQEAKE